MILQQKKMTMQLQTSTRKTSAAASTRSLFQSFSMSTVKWNVLGLIKMDFSIPKSVEEKNIRQSGHS